jgi:hypothetical protein
VLSGTVSDLLSGLASARCNGIPATITGDGAINCNVALSRGANSIVVQTMDLARNSNSMGVRVFRTEPRTAFMITPSSQSLLVGDTLILKVLDQLGMTVPEATWTSDNPAVATVSTDGTNMLSAEGPGEATVTASADGLSADVVVTVFAGSALPIGTAKWKFTAPGLGGWSMAAHQFDSEGPEQFALGEGGSLIHALNANGELLWSEPIRTLPAFADTFGGIVSPVWEDGVFVGLTRAGGATGGAPWEYRTAGWIDRHLLLLGNTSAQGPDGSIYHLEYGEPPDWAPPGFLPLDANRSVSLVTVDGQTGRVKGRTKLPANSQCGYPPFNTWAGSFATPVFVGGDGAAYVGVTTREETCAPIGGPYFSQIRTYLVRADGTGASALITVRSHDETVVCDPGVCVGDITYPGVSEVKPDGQGGVLLRGTDATYNRATGGYDYRRWMLQYRNGGVLDLGSLDIGEISLVSANFLDFWRTRLFSQL